jgi:hypothetical protein
MDYQRLKMRCWVPVAKQRDDHLDGDPALLKCLTTMGDEVVLPRPLKHLSESVRYGNLALKRRWI